MKVLTSCVFVAFAAVVVAAPTENDARRYEQQQFDFLRDKRSQYGVQYLSPCAAAAASAPMPAYSPYHYDAAPHGGYVVPHYGYGGPQYRSVDPLEAEQELLRFSDMNNMQEQMPMARYGTYGTVPAHAGPMVIPAAAPAPAFGVFPNANSGGCNVPLLFSCSPSIVQGRIVKSQPQHGYGMPVDSYRGVGSHVEVAEDNQEETPHDHSTTAEEPSHISLHKQ